MSNSSFRVYTDESEGLPRKDAPKLTNIDGVGRGCCYVNEVAVEKEHLYPGHVVRSHTAVEFLCEHRFPRLYLSDRQMLLSLCPNLAARLA